MVVLVTEIMPAEMTKICIILLMLTIILYEVQSIEAHRGGVTSPGPMAYELQSQTNPFPAAPFIKHHGGVFLSNLREAKVGDHSSVKQTDLEY